MGKDALRTLVGDGGAAAEPFVILTGTHDGSAVSLSNVEVTLSTPACLPLGEYGGALGIDAIQPRVMP